MATLDEIKTRVKDILIDVPTRTENALTRTIVKTITELQLDHNFRIMEAEEPYTTTVADHALGGLPGDWKEARGRPWLRIGEAGVLGTTPIWIVQSKGDITANYSIDDPNDKGQPVDLLEASETTIEVYPFPDNLSQWDDGNYRVVVPYWKLLPDLSAPSDTNWFTVNAEDYIVFEAAGQLFTVNWDEQRGAIWQAKAAKKERTLVNADKRSRLTKAATLTMSLGARPISRHRRR